MIQTIITNQNYENTILLLQKEKCCLKETGSFFVIFQTEYDIDGNVCHDFFDIINYAILQGYEYVNTIVLPTKDYCMCSFKDNVKYIVWLCKNQKHI